MTCSAAGHQGATRMFWLQSWGASCCLSFCCPVTDQYKNRFWEYFTQALVALPADLGHVTLTFNIKTFFYLKFDTVAVTGQVL